MIEVRVGPCVIGVRVGPGVIGVRVGPGVIGVRVGPSNLRVTTTFMYMNMQYYVLLKMTIF